MLLKIILAFLFHADSLMIDFGIDKEHNWYSLNDTVMGGKSKGTINYEKDLMRFEGDVSFQNNGGFASVRSKTNTLNLSEYEKVTVRYRCKNQSLSLNFNFYEQWYYPNYKAILPVTDMEWKEVTIQLSELKEYQVGRPTGKFIDPEKLESIIRLGIMTNDKVEGPFQAEIDFIRFH